MGAVQDWAVTLLGAEGWQLLCLGLGVETSRGQARLRQEQSSGSAVHWASLTSGHTVTWVPPVT